MLARPRAYSVKIGIIFRRPVWKEKLIKKANLHENWNMQALF